MLKLPFLDRWFVMQGGDTLNVNHHMSLPSQYYGIDFMKVGGVSSRSLNTGDGSQLEHFYSWASTVISPISGTVLEVVDEFPDNPIGTKDLKNPAGNYVTLADNNASYIYLAHLKRKSILIKKGQVIKIGEKIGECGNSGNSDYPHIHIHMQDSPIFNNGNGLNMEFSEISVELNGKHFQNVSWTLIRGLFVSNINSS